MAFRWLSDALGVTRASVPQVGREAIQRYEQTPLNYSATGKKLTSDSDVMESMWADYMRRNMGRNTGPVGVDARDAWVRAEREKFFANQANQEMARQQAQKVASREIASNRANELAGANNLSFDTNIASRGMLESAAQGKAPSAAEMMMQRRAGEVARNAMSMANSAREYNPALQMQAMNQGALAGIELGGQAAELRANEMANARNALLSADQAALGARQAQEGMRQGERQMLRQEYMGRDQMAQNQAMNVAQMDLQRQQANAGQKAAATAQQMGAFGNTMNLVGGGLMALSDENLKTNISSAEVDTDNLMEVMRPKMYEYINDQWGKGKRVGVMAQDVEKSKAGKKLIVDTSVGKAIDIPKATSALLASTARLHERLSKLEKKRSK